MILYQEQESVHDNGMFIPSLLRNDAVSRLEEEISKIEKNSDTEFFLSVEADRGKDSRNRNNQGGVIK